MRVQQNGSALSYSAQISAGLDDWCDWYGEGSCTETLTGTVDGLDVSIVYEYNATGPAFNIVDRHVIEGTLTSLRTISGVGTFQEIRYVLDYDRSQCYVFTPIEPAVVSNTITITPTP